MCVADVFISAELEITVDMLVQIDKLVQLIESPVFTCRLSHN
jgi:vacuole morphology and inheritance protein 14